MIKKTISIPLLYLGISLSVLAQSSSPSAQLLDEQYHEQQKTALALAARLFPDSTSPTSEMGKKMKELDDVLKRNNSVLYFYASKQVILGFEAAGILKAPVHWENLSGQQTILAVDDLSFALLCTKDFKKPKDASATPGAMTGQGVPGSDSDNRVILEAVPSPKDDTQGKKNGTTGK
jgi:hypothetical protein